MSSLIGGETASVLMTDGYKFSMAQAGYPLRQETFYFSFRKPGWYLIPFDLRSVLEALRPQPATADEKSFLAAHGYALTPEMQEALSMPIEISAAPRGSWVRQSEPIVRISGPSFLVSWFEAICIWLQYPIQVATEAISGRRKFVCTCQDEADIVALVLEAIGLGGEAEIHVDEDAFAESVAKHARAVCAAASPERIFEVGMRGATCLAMHRLAVQACKASGITMTSNVYLAKELGLAPVGTTGHEHQLRHGNDLTAFRAVRDMREGVPSYLFDTYDAEAIGVPAAIEVLRESEKTASVRFDSGDTTAQLRQFVAAEVTPIYIFMDGMRTGSITSLEALCDELSIPPNRRLYGVGGFVNGAAAATDLTRDRVSAVYKLSESDGPVMKFSTASKTSMPGRPTILRRFRGEGAIGLIAQAGEPAPADYQALQEVPIQAAPTKATTPPIPSPATTTLIQSLRARHFTTQERQKP